ncbi:MAG: RNA-binding S4 domain-containing protein [Vicinamibacterales bacterium]
MKTMQRLDVWLDVACLFKTRSEAQKMCKGGKIDVNGEPAKPHRMIREGDELKITRPLGRRQIVRVRGLADRHVPKADARKLYEDVTPPPTPEELEMRQLERLLRPSGRLPQGRPDLRARRAIRKAKERGA